MKLNNELLGAMIGLVRAIDQNRENVTEEMNDLLKRGMMDPGQENEDLVNALQEAKFALSPGCRTCASPCGRTSDYDIRFLDLLETEVREMKLKLLAETVCRVQDGTEEMDHLYQVLFAFGEDSWPKEDLIHLFL